MSQPPAKPTFAETWPKIEPIDGWLDHSSAALMDFMLASQDVLQAPGQGMFEIGVWRGRSAALMSTHLRPGEDLMMLDSWLQKDEIVAGMSAVMGERFQQHPIHLFHGTVREFSTTVAPAKRFRFIHVDGEHTNAGLRADLQVARQLMEPTGLIAVDDVFHYMYPQLMRELFCFLDGEGRDLACVMIGFNKAYLCRTRFLDAYSDVIFEQINAGMAERGVPVTLCRTTDRVEWPGYSVIPDIGKPRRGPDVREDYMRP